MTKDEAVRLLLLSMTRGLEDAPMATGRARVYDGAELGAQASRYVRCEGCYQGRTIGGKPCHLCRTFRENRGRLPIRPRHGCRLCLACDGRGERKRQRGDEPYDPYSGMTLTELAEKQATDSTREAPRKRTGAVLSSSEPGGDDFPWIRSRRRLWASGSYEELRRELEWLRDRHIGRYELLMHWLATHDDRMWSWPERVVETVNETILLLARRMPDPVKVPNWLMGAARIGRKIA